MPSPIHKELAFEEAIEYHLTEHGGYEIGMPADFDRELALDPKVLTTFLNASQPDQWKKLQSIHGSDIEQKTVQRVVKEIDNRGMLDVLRYGITDYGVKFQLAFFKPQSSLNPDTERLYNLNRLTVTRQVKYSTRHENSIDLLLSINGLPVATAELKNPLTNQNVEHARAQYRNDRDPKDLLFQFKKRALVHFAVDPDLVFMTTRLSGSKTRFLPFNLGHNNGAGNPPNPRGYRTAYLWEYVWTKDSWMDIIGRFLHIESTDYRVDGKSYKREALIFPRYHQLDVVRKLAVDAKESGAGKNYLVQHSAGSGKSNSIAWLAYHLASLHNEEDARVFDSVIVVTDRRVLDQQLQDTIYQFEHKTGVVQKIDRDSRQLGQALSAGANIIITTLQKFPFILDTAGTLPSRNYAVIVDEAHSSQGGEASKDLKQVLSARTLDEAAEADKDEAETDDVEDEVRKSMEARGRQPNLSFFGFTATPKARTLEVFGERDEEGKPRPFHLYSMRQAIDEKFILDVLENYVTYKTYFRLSKEIEDDPELNKKKASRAIARFVSLHPHNLAQKTEIMVEHFRRFTSRKIGGKAKAMVVTSSRLHAVRYYQEFNRYLKEKKYTDIKVLVAFSGVVRDPDNPDITYEETVLNGFREKELPERFATDEYQVLLVAEKYQTGFDQPLLHTMFVDKKLSGVRAVQTLSRLNRTAPGKEDTFVLDFANEPEEIIASFQPYYEGTAISETTDPNHLYDLKHRIESHQVIWNSEVEAFARAYFKPKDKLTQGDQKELYRWLTPATNRYEELETPEEQDDFRNAVVSFVRLYSFLSQIMPFQDAELEKLYAYARSLLAVLPKDDIAERVIVTDEVALEYYRLDKINEGSLVLEPGAHTVDPITEAGMRREKEEKAALSEIINVLNDRFGTDFDDADRLFFDQIEEELVTDESLSHQARNNTMENFKFGFEDKFTTAVIDRMEQNQDIFTRLMDNDDFRDVVVDLMLKRVYGRLRG